MKHSRRKFLFHSGIFVAGALMPPVLWKCERKSPAGARKSLWIALAEVLFPPFENSPDLKQTGFPDYLDFYLTDPNNRTVEVKRLKRLLLWFEQVMKEKNFSALSLKDRSRLIESALHDDRMEELISLLENVILEACFLDPFYGVNKNMSGWKWVRHSYGKPRPDKTSSYWKLLKKRSVTEIFTSWE